MSMCTVCVCGNRCGCRLLSCGKLRAPVGVGVDSCNDGDDDDGGGSGGGVVVVRLRSISHGYEPS